MRGEGDAPDGAAMRGSSTPERHPSARRAGPGGISRDDLVAFRGALDTSTPRTIVTPTIVALCGIVFLAMVARGVPFLWPSSPDLLDWGANDGARLALRREYWRLVASIFVHGGLIHLAVNLWSLMVVGPLVERIYGHLSFAVLYLASGVGGAIASAAVPPLRSSVGASGAICGVLGGLLAFLIVHRRAIPTTVHRHLTWNVLGVVAFMAMLGLLATNIDQAAHLGGLAVGFVAGLLLIGPWPAAPVASRRLMARRAVATVAMAAGLTAASIVVAHRGDDATSPALRLDDFCDQLAPIVREFNDIRGDVAQVIGPDDARLATTRRRLALEAMGSLRARSRVNIRRLTAIRPRRPDLRGIHESLVVALNGQVARIDALARYAETGDPEALEAARQALAATLGASEECELRRDRYLARHGLLPVEGTEPSGP